jgi:hypothetical protein
MIIKKKKSAKLSGVKSPLSANVINQRQSYRSNSNVKSSRSVISNLSACKRHQFMLVPLNEEQIKKEMTQAFTKINLDCYNDLLRIKKPQPQAMTACQMLCRMVSAFRGGQSKSR